MISNNPQSHHYRSRNSCYSHFAIILNNELRVRRYGRVATVRGPVRQLCGSTPFACARCQESASCPFRQRAQNIFRAIYTRGNSGYFAAARPRLASLETPLLPTWLRACLKKVKIELQVTVQFQVVFCKPRKWGVGGNCAGVTVYLAPQDLWHPHSTLYKDLLHPLRILDTPIQIFLGYFHDFYFE